MKCAISFLLPVLLHIVGAKFISSDVQDGSLNRNDIIDGAGRLQLKFINLDNDVLFKIFDENLDLPNLLNVASTNSRIASIATEVFRHKYHDYQIEILAFKAGFRPRETIWKDNIGMSIKPKKHIKIDDAGLALKILQYLGNGIVNLSIDEKYAKIILQKLNSPLNRIQELTVTINENNGISPFNELFPQLKKLSLNLIYGPYLLDTSFVDCEFPHLESLSIHMDEHAAGCYQQIETVIQKNPNIRAIEINGFPTDAIKIINTGLPDLENVTLYDQMIDTGKETLRLENVKHLKLIEYQLYGMTEGDPGTIDHLLCPRLESLEFQFSKWCEKWETFFENNHEHLKFLHLEDMQLQVLADFTEKLTNLVEVDIDFYLFEDIDHIKEFLQNHPNLVRAHFHSGSHQFMESSLRNRLEPLADEWNIKVFNVNHYIYMISHFVLERKN